MANILADKILYSDFSFLKEDYKIIVSNVTVSNVTFCPSKDTIAAWKNTTSRISVYLIWLCKNFTCFYFPFIIKQFQNNVS